MGVRRLVITPDLVTAVLRDGFRLSEALSPVQDAEVLDVRLGGQPRRIELLIESPDFDGPPSEGRWPAIAEGRWGEFPEYMPAFRAVPDRIIVTTDALRGADGEPLEFGPGRFELVEDPDDHHGEVPGA